MVYNFIPYMILPLYSVMSKLDKSMVEAAQDRGRKPGGCCSQGDFSFEHARRRFRRHHGCSCLCVSTFLLISQKLGGGTFSLIGDIIEMSNFKRRIIIIWARRYRSC